MTGFDVDDLMVENGTVSEFEDGDGTVTVTIAAGAAEDDERNQTAASNTLEVDVNVTAPTPVITSDAERLVARPFTITVTFDEIVTDFTRRRHQRRERDRLGLPGGRGPVRIGLHRPHHITLPEHGTVTIPIAEGAATDEAGNPTAGRRAPGRLRRHRRPTPVITPAATPPVTGPFRITITFAEPVTWFTIGDLVVTGGTASDFDDEQVEYTALTTPDESGTVTVSIPADAARNEVG